MEEEDLQNDDLDLELHWDESIDLEHGKVGGEEAYGVWCLKNYYSLKIKTERTAGAMNSIKIIFHG